MAVFVISNKNDQPALYLIHHLSADSGIVVWKRVELCGSCTAVLLGAYRHVSVIVESSPPLKNIQPRVTHWSETIDEGWDDKAVVLTQSHIFAL